MRISFDHIAGADRITHDTGKWASARTPGALEIRNAIQSSNNPLKSMPLQGEVRCHASNSAAGTAIDFHFFRIKPKTILKGGVMVQSLKAVAAMSAIVFAIGGCGLNPFGPGQGGLSIFAKIGKAMQKPSAISDKKNEESTAKAVVAAQSTAKRLAKGLASAAAEPWRLSFGLENLGGFTYKYWDGGIHLTQHCATCSV